MCFLLTEVKHRTGLAFHVFLLALDAIVLMLNSLSQPIVLSLKRHYLAFELCFISLACSKSSGGVLIFLSFFHPKSFHLIR